MNYTIIEEALERTHDEELHDFIGKTPFSLVKTMYGDCEKVSDVVEKACSYLELRDALKKLTL